MEIEKKLTVGEFAKLAKLSRKTIYNYINLGVIMPKEDASGKRYFLASDVPNARMEKKHISYGTPEKRAEVYKRPNPKYMRRLKIELLGKDTKDDV